MRVDLDRHLLAFAGLQEYLCMAFELFDRAMLADGTAGLQAFEFLATAAGAQFAHGEGRRRGARLDA
jgi:hypothetical protein